MKRILGVLILAVVFVGIPVSMVGWREGLLAVLAALVLLAVIVVALWLVVEDS